MKRQQQASLLAFFGKAKKQQEQDSVSKCKAENDSDCETLSPLKHYVNNEKAADTPNLSEPYSAQLHNSIVKSLPSYVVSPQTRIESPGATVSALTCGDIVDKGPATTNNDQLQKDNSIVSSTPPPSTGNCSKDHDVQKSRPTNQTETEETLSSSDSDSDNSSMGEVVLNNINSVNEKSDYELFRERNIARNNARLKALGLMVGLDDHASMTKQRQSDGQPGAKRKAKRKKASVVSDPFSIPTRRSTRLRTPVVVNDDLVLEVHDGDKGTSFAKDVESMHQMEQEEEFIVSPVVEYEMANGGEESCQTNVGITESEGAITECKTLIPYGPRLLPPSGLNAIYSLEFQPKTWNNNSTNCQSWLVGAGKSGLVALWDCRRRNIQESSNDMIEPVISWKSHGGRWIADARFLPPPFHGSSNENDAKMNSSPSRLLTAGNDGTVCLWDLMSTSVKTGSPKMLAQTNKMLHSSGIFSMDVKVKKSFETFIVTGSKDKSIAVSTLDRFNNDPLWRSNFHSAKVGSVSFSSSDINPLIASASDDGLVAIHDARLNGTTGATNGVVTQLEYSHFKPHSAVWKPNSDHLFLTAGLEDVIKFWDLRHTSFPFATFHGHVPGSGKKLKRIHRPAFLTMLGTSGASDAMRESFILSGGEGSHSISMFQLDTGTSDTGEKRLHSVFSRGKLPPDVGDIGSLAVLGRNVAVAVEGGEVLMLSPKD